MIWRSTGVNWRTNFGQTVRYILKIIEQLFDVTEKFNIQTQLNFDVTKTMVVVENVAKKIQTQTFGPLLNPCLKAG